MGSKNSAGAWVGQPGHGAGRRGEDHGGHGQVPRALRRHDDGRGAGAGGRGRRRGFLDGLSFVHLRANSEIQLTVHTQVPSEDAHWEASLPSPPAPRRWSL